jgi:hypothetical protein
VADATPGIFANRLLGVVQCFADKQVRLAVIARVFGLDLYQCLFETDFLHITVVLLQRPVPADARCDTI